MKKALLLVLIAISSCSSGNDALRIATAANMQFAMEALIEAFEKSEAYDAEMILSSSGKLTAQIEAGAPFDLFFSADLKYPQRLADEGLCGTPTVYAYGQLVLWEKDNSQNKLYAMANPKTAPYGVATEEYLKNTHIELADVVFGESIAQVNQFLLSGTVDGGYTAAAVMGSSAFQGKGKFTPLADSLYAPIAQAFVILNDSPKKMAAEAFVEFLSTETAKGIIKAYGYRTN